MESRESARSILEAYSILEKNEENELSRDTWASRLSSEFSYWDRALPKIRPAALDRERMNSEIKKIVNRDKLSGRVLDVGSGPFPIELEGCEVTAVDPLANELSNVLRKNNFSVPDRYLATSGEEVGDHIMPSSFDIVTCDRGLDQCYCPKEFVRGMLHACRPGGRILIVVADVWNALNRIRGSRHWNSIFVDEDLILWRPNEAHSLRSLFENEAVISFHQVSNSIVAIEAVRNSSAKKTQNPNYANIYDKVYSSAHTYTASHTSPGLRTALSKSSLIQAAGRKHLDVGAGPGYLVEVLSMPPFRKDSIGVDISPVAVDLATNRLGSGKVLVMEKGRLPFDDDFFDLVTCFDVLEHLDIEDARNLVSEIKRVLRKGSLALFNISLRDSSLKDLNGDSVHRSILSPQDWDEICNFDRYEINKREHEMLGEIDI